jgi:hypothetical protein
MGIAERKATPYIDGDTLEIQRAAFALVDHIGNCPVSYQQRVRDALLLCNGDRPCAAALDRPPHRGARMSALTKSILLNCRASSVPPAKDVLLTGQRNDPHQGRHSASNRRRLRVTTSLPRLGHSGSALRLTAVETRPNVGWAADTGNQARSALVFVTSAACPRWTIACSNTERWRKLRRSAYFGPTALASSAQASI